MPTSARSRAAGKLPEMSPEILADVIAFLAERGRTRPARPDGAARRAARGQPPRGSEPGPPDAPTWDGPGRRLRFRGKTIWKFKRRAPRQMAVLDALERGRWSPHGVPNPFLGSLVADLARRRLHETVTNMNRQLKKWGLALREDGQRVWWERLV